MVNNKEGISPQVYARVCGVAYLVIIATGIFGEVFVRNKIIVPGDAAATANNIVNSALLWRIGLAGDILMHLCDVVTMTIFFVLLRTVNKNLALAMLLFNLIQTSVLVANKMNLVLPLFLTGNANYLEAFNPHQLQALTYLSVKAHEFGFGIGLIFFGVECLILGYLIFKSGFLPRVLGILIQIAGLCYLTNSFSLILSPAFAGLLFPYILFPAFIGELSLCLWLIVKGVNVSKWKERLT